jgi:hypothetical protein
MNFPVEFVLGPILFVKDLAPDNQMAGIVLCLLLIPCMLVGVLRPRWWSIAISVNAALSWLFEGIVGSGIDA